MLQFALVNFLDGNVKKIVPLSQVRRAGETLAFKPAAAQDTEGKFQVKWQNSDPQTSTDGFFDANLICMAETVEEARAKARDLHIKLASHDLLIVAKSFCKEDDDTCSEVQNQNSRKRKRTDSPAKKKLITSESKDNRAKEPVKKKKVKTGNKSKTVDKKVEQPSTKVNKMLDDKVVAQRVAAALNLAKTVNPLLKESRPPTPPRAASPCNAEEKEMEQVPANNDHHDKDDAPSQGESNVSSLHLRERMDTMPVENIEALFLATKPSTTEKAVEQTSSLSSCDSTSEDDSNESNGSECEVGVVIDRNLKLLAGKQKLKNELAELQRQYGLTNNMRVAHWTKLKELETVLTSRGEQIKELNANVLSKDEKIDNLNKILLSKDRDIKKKEEQIERLQEKNFQLQDTLLIELKKGSHVKGHRNPETIRDHKERNVREDYVHQVEETVNTSITQQSTPTNKKPSSPFVAPKSFKKTSESFENQGLSMSPVGQDEDLALPLSPDSPHLSHQIQQEKAELKTPLEKLKKQGRKLTEEDYTAILAVSSGLMGHLLGDNKLIPDEKGNLQVGCGVTLSAKGFEQAFKSYKDDQDKLTRALTMLIWTERERANRSLDGTPSNSNKNVAPKQRATPAKIRAAIGAIHAHLTIQGVPEGSVMRSLLMKAKKTIGTKFCEEGGKAARKLNLTEKPAPGPK